MAGIEDLFEKFGAKTDTDQILIRQLLELQNLAIAAAPPGGLATEGTLLDVVAGLDAMRDYEVRLVTDSDAPVVTWLEVRYWDAQSGTLGAPVYYPAGSTIAGSPVLPVSYINPNALLAQMLAELISQTASLSSLDSKFNTLGQKASANSAPVVLSTEQEVILDAIKTAVEAIDMDTNGLNLEATQLLIKGVLDAMKLDTANLDVLLSTRNAEATQVLVKNAVEAINTKLTKVTRTASLVEVTTSGNVALGARSVTFKNNSPAGINITVAGGPLAPGEAVSFSAGAEEDDLASIAYTIPATGKLKIAKVV